MDIEIFATGTWGGRSWSSADLDQMVRNFEALRPRGILPPVKLGHADRQILAQHDGQPALGWIASLYRRGQKLIATVQDMPAVLAELVRKKRYRRVSSEIYPHFEKTNAEANLKSGVQGCVLSAVAFLGADIPEVKTLEDLGQLLAGEGAAPFKIAAAEPTDTAVDFTADLTVDADEPWTRETHPPTRGNDTNDPKRGGADMTEAEIKALLAEQAKASDKAWEARLAEQATTLRAELRAEHAAATDTAVKAATAPLTDEVAQLREQNKKLQDSQRAAEDKAAEAMAKHFVESRTTPQNFRLHRSQHPAALALYRYLSGRDDVIVKAAESASVLKLDEKQARDYDAVALLELFVDGYPHQGHLARETAHGTGPGDGGDPVALAERIGKELGLDMSKYEDRQKAFDEAARRGGTAPYYGDPSKRHLRRAG